MTKQSCKNAYLKLGSVLLIFTLAQVAFFALKSSPARSRKTEVYDSNFTVVRDWVWAEDPMPAFHASITLTTHASLEYLLHVGELSSRWRAPISVAVYAPGDDLAQTLSRINWLRACAPGVRENVTWHLIYNREHPPHLPPSEKVVQYNCSEPPVVSTVSYREARKLLYPINVLRNVARRQARTRYVLASDVELYPSENVVPSFLRLMADSDVFTPRDVFVLPIFEVEASLKAPRTKTELVKLLASKKAVYFHKFVCDICQKFPGRDHWHEAGVNPEDPLQLFSSTRRNSSYGSWEPIYIGTDLDPRYEERLSWEGKRDKMTQMYEMCLLEYNIHVLSNAFLVHAPGIKQLDMGEVNLRGPFEAINLKIYKQVLAALVKKHGSSKNC